MKRRFFDASIDAFFYTNDDGITAFFPAGVLGRRGVLVESSGQERALRAAVRRAFIVFMVAAVVIAMAYTLVLFASLEWLLGFFMEFEHGLYAYFALKYLPMLAIALLMGAAMVAHLRRHTAGMEPVAFPNGNTHSSQLLKVNPSLLRITTLLSTIVLAGYIWLAVIFTDIAGLVLVLMFGIPHALFTAFLWKGVLTLSKQEKAGHAS